MRITIPACSHCPLMPDCKHRADIRSDFAKMNSAIPITVNYKCKLYQTLFKEGDEVLVTFWDGYSLGKHGEKYRAVVLGVKGTKYAIAFIDEPYSERNERKLLFGKAKAKDLQFVGRYKGERFWEVSEYPSLTDPYEERIKQSLEEVII